MPNLKLHPDLLNWETLGQGSAFDVSQALQIILLHAGVFQPPPRVSVQKVSQGKGFTRSFKSPPLLSMEPPSQGACSCVISISWECQCLPRAVALQVWRASAPGEPAPLCLPRLMSPNSEWKWLQLESEGIPCPRYFLQHWPFWALFQVLLLWNQQPQQPAKPAKPRQASFRSADKTQHLFLSPPQEDVFLLFAENQICSRNQGHFQKLFRHWMATWPNFSIGNGMGDLEGQPYLSSSVMTQAWVGQRRKRKKKKELFETLVWLLLSLNPLVPSVSLSCSSQS